MSARQQSSAQRTKQDLALLLLEALTCPVGLLLRVGDPAKFRQRLYAARREALDPSVAGLQFRIVDYDGGNLAIVKGQRQEGDPA